MELCPTSGQKTHFSSAFCPFLSLWKDCKLETFPFCMAISWPGCWWPALSAPGPAIPLIQDPRKPLVRSCIRNAQNRNHDTLQWWNTSWFVGQKEHVAPLKIHSMSCWTGATCGVFQLAPLKSGQGLAGLKESHKTLGCRSLRAVSASAGS